QPGLGAGRDRRARRRARREVPPARRYGRGRRARGRVPPGDRPLRARARNRPRVRHRRAVPGGGRGVRRRRAAFRRRRGPDRRGAEGDCREHRGAGERLALHAHGARGAGPRRGAAERGTLMLLALTQWLAQDVRAFNVFQYITLRAVLATLTALAISLLAGPLVIRKLTAYKIGQ